MEPADRKNHLRRLASIARRLNALNPERDALLAERVELWDQLRSTDPPVAVEVMAKASDVANSTVSVTLRRHGKMPDAPAKV